MAEPTPGAILRDYRTSAGLSQRELAERLGISASYLSDIEQSRRHFPPGRLRRLPRSIQERIRVALHSKLDAEITFEGEGRGK